MHLDESQKINLAEGQWTRCRTSSFDTWCPWSGRH